MRYIRDVLGISYVRILSAEHYVLDPAQLIHSYDLSLRDLPVQERREWGLEVGYRLMDSLSIQVFEEGEFERLAELASHIEWYVLAGKVYADALTWLPPSAHYPLRGKGGMGKQQVKDIILGIIATVAPDADMSNIKG